MHTRKTKGILLFVVIGIEDIVFFNGMKYVKEQKAIIKLSSYSLLCRIDDQRVTNKKKLKNMLYLQSTHFQSEIIKFLYIVRIYL